MTYRFDLVRILQCAALFMFCASIIRTIYLIVMPSLELDFHMMPRAWFQIRFYLEQFTNALFQPFLLLGLAELLKLKKGNSHAAH